MTPLILSDLHLEHFDSDRHELLAEWPVKNGYDTVFLAGDIHSGTAAIDWASKAFGNTPVIFVPGNHEYYGSLLQRRAIEMKAAANDTDNVVMLDNDVIIRDGVRIIGTTLWADFRLFGDSQNIIDKAMAEAFAKINDYRCIRFGSTGWMTVSNSAQMAVAAIEWLSLKIAEPFDGKTIVISHHLPCLASVAARYKNDPLTAAYASDLSGLMDGVDLWVHGHTHDSADIEINGCRVICNPAGYPVSAWSTLVDGRQNEQFNPGLIVDTDSLRPRGALKPKV